MAPIGYASQALEAALINAVQTVHVGNREADIFELFANRAARTASY